MATDSITDDFLAKLNQCRREINQLFIEISTKLYERRQALLEQLDGIEKRYAYFTDKAEDSWKQLTDVLNEQKPDLAFKEKSTNIKTTQQKTYLENISNLTTPETKEAQLKTINPMTEATINMKLAIKDMEQDCNRWRVKIEAFTNISFQANTTQLTNSINELGAISINVPDYTNRTTPIVLYDAARATGKGELHAPYGIVLDNDNNIYITDWYNKKIIVFSIVGKFIREFGQGYLYMPHYLCITNTNIYVSDIYVYIVKFSIAGEFIGKIGTRGSNNNQFNRPCGIAYYNTFLYISDMDNNRIQVLSEELKYHKTIKHDKILWPRDIKIQHDSIYVNTDTSIHILSIAGEYISTLPHTFKCALYITLDSYNNIIISSSNCITIISQFNNSIMHTIYSNSTRGIAVTSSDNLVNVCSSFGTNAKLLYF